MAQNPSHLHAFFLGEIPGTCIQAPPFVEGGGLVLWRGKGAAGLLWWVFQDRISLVEAQGDGVIEIIVLHLGVVETQQVCGHIPLAGL